MVLTYAEAAAGSLADAMAGDDTIVVLGEDLGRGGVFGQYRVADARGAVSSMTGDAASSVPASATTGASTGATIGAGITGEAGFRHGA